jgi:putative sigma-54 modulation protein
MDSELTGRKVKVTRELRKLADEGLAHIEKIVGGGANAHVIFSAQKLTQIAEVTVNARHHTVVGLGEASELSAALRIALEKAEKQALRRKKSMQEKKRQGRSIGAVLPDPAEEKQAGSARGRAANGRKNGRDGLHVISTPGAMASRSMTLEEAVKEAESLNHDVFVFRDPLGDVKVLHCAGDGIVRLIEVS